MNRNPFANGSVIYTQKRLLQPRICLAHTMAAWSASMSAYRFRWGVFPFAGHKNSFFGDQHVLGKDGIRFYTESKIVTTKWFDEEEKAQKKSRHLGRQHQLSGGSGGYENTSVFALG